MFQLDEHKLFDLYAAGFSSSPLHPAQMIGAAKLFGFLSLDADVSDIRWAAYMLATVKHECADTWEAIGEHGDLHYFDRYEGRLGNCQPGDAYRFRGRGYVQITGRGNYQKLGKCLGMGDQLVANPELALVPDVAYRIMSYGMRHGVFTGRKLADYIQGGQCDYRNARRIINALDQAERIQGYAQQFEAMLRASQLEQSAPQQEVATHS